LKTLHTIVRELRWQLDKERRDAEADWPAGEFVPERSP
jgi:hypothetical protein